MTTKRVLGIDLGATYARIAVVGDDGAARVLATPSGYRAFPSVVARRRSGDWLVGHVARRQAHLHPSHTVGRLKARAVDGAPIPLGDGTIRVEEAIGRMLGHLRRVAQSAGERTVQVVIAVPATFGERECEVFRHAGRFAGLDVIGFIEEPVAAVVGAGLDVPTGRRVLVLDLGGSAFTASVIEGADDRRLVVAASAATPALGGERFDARLVDSLRTVFLERYGFDFTRDAMAMQRVVDAVERARWELAVVQEAEVHLPYLASVGDPFEPLHLRSTFTRAEVEELCTEVAALMIRASESLLEREGITVSDLDGVLLVGGLARMPCMLRAMANRFGRVLPSRAEPDERVALGAARVGARLGGSSMGAPAGNGLRG